MLSNVRVIRDYEDNGELPAEVAREPIVDQTSVVWDRRRLDGGGGYRLAIDVLEGSVSGGSATPVTFAPGPEGTLRLRATALTGDTPLTPLAEDHLQAPRPLRTRGSAARSHSSATRRSCCRLLALQHLLRPRHPDVDPPACPRPGARRHGSWPARGDRAVELRRRGRPRGGCGGVRDPAPAEPKASRRMTHRSSTTR